ncbi:MAG: SerRS, partial [Pseudomonadota bacterium]
MLDIKWIRENPEEFDKALAKRGLQPHAKEILSLDAEKRSLITKIQELQHQRKERSKSLGGIKDKSGSEFAEAKKEVEKVNAELESMEVELEKESKLDLLLNSLPNVPAEDVPVGKDEAENKLLKTVGTPPKIEAPMQHFDLGERLGMMDFAQTSKISGSRFVTLKSYLARLERALANFMLDTHTKEFGYTEVSPPALVKNQAMYNVGQLPKFEEDSFLTTNGYRLIPTSE